MEEIVTSTHKVSRITPERRWEYLKDLEFNSQLDYNFRFLKHFDISELAEYMKKFDSEWHEQTLLQERYTSQRNTNAMMVAIVENSRENPQMPFISTIVTEDEKLLSLVMPMVKEVEDIYNGHHGRIWLAKLPKNKKHALHRDQYDVFRHRKTADFHYSLAVYRIHIPIITNEGVIFTVNNEKKHMSAGECWDMSNNVDHTVENYGDEDRIHLVIDMLPYKWL